MNFKKEDLLKVYYTQGDVVSLECPFIIESEDLETFTISLSFRCVDLSKSFNEQKDDLIYIKLFNQLKDVLGHSNFLLMPSQRQVETDAYTKTLIYRFPIDYDLLEEIEFRDE